MARIIAADDSRTQLTLYRYMLEEMGHSVRCCRDGLKVLEEFSRGPADIVLLDVNMPGMNGIDTCLEIKKRADGVAVPVIMVSANSEESDIARGLDSGADDYLTKPVKNKELRAKIRSLLDKASMSGPKDSIEKFHTLLAGRYEIIDKVGQGAHSSVYLAEDIKDKARKAVKLFNPEITKDKELLKKITETLKVFSGFGCEHIIKIFDYGMFQGRLYAVMEFAEGGDLLSYSRKMLLSESEAVSVALDILRAFKYMNARNIFHLDVKPENIMLQGLRFKLADFGFSQERATSTLPVNAEFWSSAAYMPPEFLTGGGINEKCDIYSLGISLYQVVSGINPFIEKSASASMYKQVNITPPPLNTETKDISALFSDTVMGMLSKDAAERPAISSLEYAFSHVSKKKDYPAAGNPSEPVKKVFDYFFAASLSCNPCLMAGQKFNYSKDFSSPFFKRVEGRLAQCPRPGPTMIETDYFRMKPDMGENDFKEVNEMLTKNWRSGRIVGLSWFPGNPWTNGPSTDISTVREFSALSKPGSPVRINWQKELGKLSKALLALKNENVPVLWKPFPRMNGGMNFWWGSLKTRMVPPDEFRKLWTQLFEYLCVEKKLNNLLWVYAPNIQEDWFNSEKVYYPGRDYVDIIELEYNSRLPEFENYRQLSLLGKSLGISGIPHYSQKNNSNFVDAKEMKKEYSKLSFVIYSEKNIKEGHVNYTHSECPFFRYFAIPEKAEKQISEVSGEAKSKTAARPAPKPFAAEDALKNEKKAGRKNSRHPLCQPEIVSTPEKVGKRKKPVPKPSRPVSRSKENEATAKERLALLKELYEESLITEEEYKEKKKDILNAI